MLAARGVSPQEASLVEAAWRLGGRKELAHLHLRHWAHQLGYRHCITHSRCYSTTLTALRAEHESARRAEKDVPARRPRRAPLDLDLRRHRPQERRRRPAREGAY